ncbi:MAG: hypothetical protein AB8B85_23725 [Paracoccaceae bacterium]
MIEAHRLGNGPIVHPGMCDSLGDNINGPSVVERPDWAPGPGRLMLYFAHHKGQHIRLAFAERPTGPWQICRPGVLPLADTPLALTRPDTPQPAWARGQNTDGLYPHLASPDVWIDDDARHFRMLFHGLAEHGEQVSYQASSPDGLHWKVDGPPIAETYLRRFICRDKTYAMARLGILMRETPEGWETGAQAIPGSPRHVAVLVRGEVLSVFFTRIGDMPERLMHAALDLSPPWPDWQAGSETELLRPELDWEGAREPLRPSSVGAVDFAHELRDPEVFEFEGKTYLVYSGAGEAALGIAELRGLRSGRQHLAPAQRRREGKGM